MHSKSFGAAPLTRPRTPRMCAPNKERLGLLTLQPTRKYRRIPWMDVYQPDKPHT